MESSATMNDGLIKVSGVLLDEVGPSWPFVCEVSLLPSTSSYRHETLCCRRVPLLFCILMEEIAQYLTVLIGRKAK